MAEGLGAYLAMGGHAAYVWPAFAAAVAVLGVLLLQSRRRLRAGEAALRDLEAARPRRERGP